MAKRKLSIKEFQRSLQEYIANLRQTIEAECLGFDVNPQATQARRAAVCDPVTATIILSKTISRTTSATGKK